MRVLVTGGAGFIGCNAAAYFAGRGADVVCVDNFSRRGAGENARWLREDRGVETIRLDLKDAEATARVFREHGPDYVIHAAGQVAVTTSVEDPRRDFEDNALATLNVLEAARSQPRPPFVLFTSTNKVYGGMEDVVIVEQARRYAYRDLSYGASEDRPLDFHSPYGCSKGAADQYVRDYHRIYGLPTVVFRQSCIYGPRQFGVEDQGWVAWFTIRAVQGRPVTIYGDGKQIRDILHVDDLCAAFGLAWERRAEVAGSILNIGGGPRNTLSLRELLEDLGRTTGRPVAHTFAPWRPGDQRVFVADIRRAGERLGWEPRVNPREGVAQLHGWIVANQTMFQ